MIRKPLQSSERHYPLEMRRFTSKSVNPFIPQSYFLTVVKGD